MSTSRDDRTAATPLDTNGDGVVQFGVAAAGPRDDGAYYQALVTKVEEFSEANGFEAPIIVDNITAEDAATELANIAEQGVDVITVGASEIADPLADLVEQYPDIFWYCNCGAGYPENPGLAQSQDDASEINYTAGYATGLLLQDSGRRHRGRSSDAATSASRRSRTWPSRSGLQAVDPAFTMTYVPTGNFPFDFDNTAGATEAFNTALAEGVDAVYPFLGGAHEPRRAARQRGRDHRHVGRLVDGLRSRRPRLPDPGPVRRRRLPRPDPRPRS